MLSTRRLVIYKSKFTKRIFIVNYFTYLKIGMTAPAWTRTSMHPGAVAKSRIINFTPSRVITAPELTVWHKPNNSFRQLVSFNHATLKRAKLVRLLSLIELHHNAKIRSTETREVEGWMRGFGEVWWILDEGVSACVRWWRMSEYKGYEACESFASAAENDQIGSKFLLTMSNTATNLVLRERSVVHLVSKLTHFKLMSKCSLGMHLDRISASELG